MHFFVDFTVGHAGFFGRSGPWLRGSAAIARAALSEGGEHRVVVVLQTSHKVSAKPSRDSLLAAVAGKARGRLTAKSPVVATEFFTALDVQSATRWQLTEIKDRTLDFQWHYKAVHPVAWHEYFITRNGWNPNEVLKRTSFEGTPFCRVEGDFQNPLPGIKHRCNIREDKNGQHVILAIWGVGDTKMAFHNVLDVNIIAEPSLPGGWSSVGAIAPSTPLLAGDKVKARAFTATAKVLPTASKSRSTTPKTPSRKTGRSNSPSRSTRPTP